MYSIYFDESASYEDQDNPNKKPKIKNYRLACIIIHQNDVADMEVKLRRYEADFFKGRYKDAEIHLYKIYQRRGEFKKISTYERDVLLKGLYAVVDDLKFDLIAVTINRKKHLQHNDDHLQLYQMAYKILLEELYVFLIENNDKGIIFIDKSTSPEEINLNLIDSNISKLVNEILQHTSDALSFKLFKEPIRFESSVNFKGLQLADSVVYAIHKLLDKNEDFEPYRDIISSKFIATKNHTANNFGIIEYP